MTARTINVGGNQGRGDPLASWSEPATPPERPRSWRLEFEAHGMPWTWTGTAADEAQAEARARRELAHMPDWVASAARLVACIER